MLIGEIASWFLTWEICPKRIVQPIKSSFQLGSGKNIVGSIVEERINTNEQYINSN